MKISWKDFCKEASSSANNMFNMRHYGQGWLGEDSSGLQRGDFLKFKSPYYGFRAGARNVLNLLDKKVKSPTIRELTPVYSPPSENNTDRHMRAISQLAGIGVDDPLDTKDDGQMFRLLTGLAIAESGHRSLKGLTRDSILKAIRSSRRSVPSNKTPKIAR